MKQQGLTVFAVLAVVVLASSSWGQTDSKPSLAHPMNSSSTSSPAARSTAGALAFQVKTPASGTPQSQIQSGLATEPGKPGTSPTNSAGQADCFGGDCDMPAPRIAISTPAPAPAPWLWQERVAWGANLVLVVLTYVAIMLAVSLLRKIERQAHHVEEAIQAANESARAAMEGSRAVLKHAEALERAERSWLLVEARPAHNVDNGFTVIAVNRGRGPAQIVSTVEEMVCAVNESYLEPTPVYQREASTPAEPIILLPGEVTDLVTFSRGDVNKLCDTEEQLRRVENWEERIYIYGKVMYRDLTAPDNAPAHESSWLCWYIHGRQKSGMVMATLPSYNKHT